MIKVGNKIIQASVMDIIIKFREYADKNGIKVFKDIKLKGQDVIVTCPNRNHKHMNENNPSCSIANRDIGEVREGTLHCFSCGYAASLDYTLSQVMGIHDNGEFGRQWLIENFINSEDESRDINLDLTRGNKSEDINYITEEELDLYRYSHPYWEKRKINEDTCIRFDLGFDRGCNSITMPCYDYSGRCIGVTKRRVDRKVFHIPEGVTKPIYLLNFAIRNNIKEIYLCESQINALYLNSLGYMGCACFGTGSESQAKDLLKYGIRSIIFCFDGDNSGRKGRERMNTLVQKRILCSYVDLPEGKDINDLSPGEIKDLFNNIKQF